MTKVRFIGPIGGFSGEMDGMVFADHKKKNRTVAYLKKHHDPTEGQLNVQARFKEAALYAKTALSNPSKRALYQAIAEQRDETAHLIALTDFLVVPEFKPLDLSEYKGQAGDRITIRAKDDIGLADLIVTITANDGTQIETGFAVEEGLQSGKWTYTATASVALGSDIFIELVGFDHARNKAQRTESPRVGEAA